MSERELRPGSSACVAVPAPPSSLHRSFFSAQSSSRVAPPLLVQVAVGVEGATRTPETVCGKTKGTCGEAKKGQVFKDAQTWPPVFSRIESIEQNIKFKRHSVRFGSI